VSWLAENWAAILGFLLVSPWLALSAYLLLVRLPLAVLRALREVSGDRD